MKTPTPVNDLKLVVHLPRKFWERPRFTFLEEEILDSGIRTPWKFEVGFHTDGHSVPPLLRGIWPNLDRQFLAACAHDQDCRESLFYKSFKMRRTGDKHYLHNQKFLGCPLWSRWLRYLAVTGYSYTLLLKRKYVEKR